MNKRTSNRSPIGLDIALPILWALATIGALLITLESLKQDDFDGLNNIFQIPLALPWFLLPTAALLDNVQDAWVAFGEGLLNAFLLHLWLRRRKARHPLMHRSL